MEETIARTREAKRVYSRVGLGLTVMFLVEIALSLGLGLLFHLDQVEGPSIRWTVFGQIIPVYASILAGYLVLRRLPAEPPEKRALRPGQFLRLPPHSRWLIRQTSRRSKVRSRRTKVWAAAPRPNRAAMWRPSLRP